MISKTLNKTVVSKRNGYDFCFLFVFFNDFTMFHKTLSRMALPVLSPTTEQMSNAVVLNFSKLFLNFSKPNTRHSVVYVLTAN